MTINDNTTQHQRDAATIWNTAAKTEAGWRAAVAEHARLPDAWRNEYIAVQRASNAWLAGKEIPIPSRDMIFAIETESATAERRAAREKAKRP